MLWAATMVAAAEMRAAEYFMVAVGVVWRWWEVSDRLIDVR
jgi:hypothetical protein